MAIEHYQFVANASDVTVDDQVNYINYALSKWGDWPRMNILRNAMSELRQPSFNINIGDVSFLPQQERLVRINFIRNINTLTVNIYRVNVEGDCSLNPNEPADWAVLQKKLVPGAVQTLVKRYVGQPAWKENTDSLIIGGLPVGMYVMEATTDNGNVKAQRALLHVSDVYVMCQGLPDNQQRFVVVNATTGEAIAGAHLRLKTQTYYDNEKEQTVHLTTDKNGEAYHKFKNVLQTRYTLIPTTTRPAWKSMSVPTTVSTTTTDVRRAFAYTPIVLSTVQDRWCVWRPLRISPTARP